MLWACLRVWGGNSPGMFTGLIEAMGELVGSEASAAGRRLVVEVRGWGYTARRGDSVAVNGVCLTAVRDSGVGGVGRFEFDVVPETLSKTTLGGLSVGARVHVEQAATMATLLGGHMVLGHVDGVGRVVANGEREGGGWVLEIECPAGTMEYMVPKGSVAVEGVSLTLAAVEAGAGRISIALIPTTLEKTTLGGLRPGDGVNIECDGMAKTVVQYLKHFLRGEKP